MKSSILIFALALASTVSAQQTECDVTFTVLPNNGQSHSFTVVSTTADGFTQTICEDYRGDRFSMTPSQGGGASYQITMSLLVGDVPYEHVIKDTYVINAKSTHEGCLSVFLPNKTVGDFSTLSIR
tara:strand:- start:366 stop:743 length:378 start_codon:yes stop_codon:yes gene_type:complete